MLSRKQAQNVIREWAFQTLTGACRYNDPTPVYSLAEQALLANEKRKFLSQISSHVTKVTLSSNKMDWLTPPYFMDLVRQVGPIALDPCANVMSFVRAWVSYYGDNHINGLLTRWYTPENCVCFVNPPYGRTLALWANKMATDGPTIIANANAHLIALIPARTGTGYWEQFIWPFADAVCFWHGGTLYPSRMCFYGLDGRPAETGATFDAAVVYYGKRRDRFKDVFGAYGTVQFVN